MANTDKTVSAAELKTFIDAVEFAADSDDWIPSKRQWERIRGMIERLDVTPPGPPAYAPPVMMALPQAPVDYGPSRMSGGMMPPQHQGIPQGVPIAGGNPLQAVRAPDIDTSNGQYKSAFA